MNWLMPVAMSIFGGIAGYGAGSDMREMAREQERLAERNALLEKRELDETVRRQEAEDKRVRSAALARAAASGARIESGSVMESLMFLEEEQGRQLEWTKSAGASRIRLKLEGDRLRAKTLAQQGKNQQISSIIGGITSAFGYANQGGNFTDYDMSSLFTRKWTSTVGR